MKGAEISQGDRLDSSLLGQGTETEVMPQLGEIIRGKLLGKVAGNQYYIWSACNVCGRQGWVIRRYRSGGRPWTCPECAKKLLRGSGNGNWKGGGGYGVGGYKWVAIYPDDFFFPMARRDGCIAEHRLTMARYLGRLLLPQEVVHHKNGIKDDNRIDNLELALRGEHISSHSQGYHDGYQKGLYDGRIKQIELLKGKIRQLEAQINKK